MRRRGPAAADAFAAAVELRRNHTWLDHAITRLLADEPPWSGGEKGWLDQLAYAYRVDALHRAACELYENDHPESHGSAEAYDRWVAGLPDRPHIVDKLRALDIPEDVAFKLLLSLSTSHYPPGWRVIDFSRMGQRQGTFVEDWLDAVRQITEVDTNSG